MKKIISIFLSIFLVITLIAQAFFISVQQKVALIPEAKALSFTKEDLEKYSNMSTSDLHKEFDSYIEKEGLPTEILDYVVEDPEFKESVDQFKSDYIEYAKGNTDVKPKIDNNKVTKIIDKSIKKYNKDNKKDIVYDGASKISETITNKMDDVVEVLDESPAVNKVISFVYNETFQNISLLATISLIIILIIINKKKVLNYISIPLMVSALVLIASYFIKYFSLIKVVTNLLGEMVDKIFNTMLIFGIVYLVISIILIIINIVLKKKTVEQ